MPKINKVNDFFKGKKKQKFWVQNIRNVDFKEFYLLEHGAIIRFLGFGAKIGLKVQAEISFLNFCSSLNVKPAFQTINFSIFIIKKNEGYVISVDKVKQNFLKNVKITSYDM